MTTPEPRFITEYKERLFENAPGSPNAIQPKPKMNTPDIVHVPGKPTPEIDVEIREQVVISYDESFGKDFSVMSVRKGDKIILFSGDELDMVEDLITTAKAEGAREMAEKAVNAIFSDEQMCQEAINAEPTNSHLLGRQSGLQRSRDIVDQLTAELKK
jgi:hypothetical protein